MDKKDLEKLPVSIEAMIEGDDRYIMDTIYELSNTIVSDMTTLSGMDKESQHNYISNLLKDNIIPLYSVLLLKCNEQNQRLNAW